MSAAQQMAELIRQNDALQTLHAMRGRTLGIVYLAPNFVGEPVWDVLDDMRGVDYKSRVIGRGKTPAEAIEAAAAHIGYKPVPETL